MGADVLAPFDGIVESIYINPVTNTPGNFQHSRARSIRFLGHDDVRVCFSVM
ncbi:hypothetical protein DFP97_117156 [Paenibacillus prosopidis]|uniref:Uncharacterized protein n=1 Tax=Paenibacillus prosopidis TaxID=630520 RepID=A0A368VNJ0_9BACL|nr:hypothetical protein DFP97_117156 [Paenibacillus prosopidis]